MSAEYNKYRRELVNIYRALTHHKLTIQRHPENLSLNLSPFRRETLNFPPSRVGKGVRFLVDFST
ncbi:hypothetical protein ANSO36C_51490 [Nostoc cf. commune SO-36]|uniref:Uncharacterized protein n=1 Tax=Nostoc cf. commune SO-36 TaxID=449208 RepID=A0ABM7Z849_NOSCO|nr:hypothetical protein ANSO36C_51490 [Nostoc cf. commune SO-36]